MATETQLQLKKDLNNPEFVEKVAQALPAHVKPETLIRSILVAAQKNPAIQRCSKASIFTAALDAASLGLDCSGGTLGHGYLVPYGQTCQFIPGYRGLIDLARRAGDFKQFEAEVVYAKDQFQYRRGLSPQLDHVPTTAPDRGDITHAYAIARTKDGDVQFAVLTKAEVDAIRKRSKAATSGPWVTDYAEMAKKTAIRRLIKLLPISAEHLLMKAAAIADREFDLERQSVTVQPGADRGDLLLNLPRPEPVDAEYQDTPAPADVTTDPAEEYQDGELPIG